MRNDDSRPVDIEPAALELLETPLAFIEAEHRRQSALCDLLEDIAAGPRLQADKAEAVARYLAQDIVLHVIDEEEDLFPLLRRRCRPEDDIASVLGSLSGDHQDEESLAVEIREALSELAGGETPISEHPDLQAKLTTFAKRARRHLEIENAVVLPLAASRLTDLDKADFARRLAARRGASLTVANA